MKQELYLTAWGFDGLHVKHPGLDVTILLEKSCRGIVHGKFIHWVQTLGPEPQPLARPGAAFTARKGETVKLSKNTRAYFSFKILQVEPGRVQIDLKVPRDAEVKGSAVHECVLQEHAFMTIGSRVSVQIQELLPRNRKVMARFTSYRLLTGKIDGEPHAFRDTMAVCPKVPLRLWRNECTLGDDPVCLMLCRVTKKDATILVRTKEEVDIR